MPSGAKGGRRGRDPQGAAHKERTVGNRTELIDRYLAVWNETDPGRRGDLIARTWTDDASYVDPVMHGEGRAGIDALVQGAQAQFPGHQFRLLGTVDSYQDRVRFSWELAPDGGAAIVRGTDFGVVAADGRLRAVTGFLDQVPA